MTNFPNEIQQLDSLNNPDSSLVSLAVRNFKETLMQQGEAAPTAIDNNIQAIGKLLIQAAGGSLESHSGLSDEFNSLEGGDEVSIAQHWVAMINLVAKPEYWPLDYIGNAHQMSVSIYPTEREGIDEPGAFDSLVEIAPTVVFKRIGDDHGQPWTLSEQSSSMQFNDLQEAADFTTSLKEKLLS